MSDTKTATAQRAIERQEAKRVILSELSQEVKRRQRNVEMLPRGFGYAYRRELLRLSRLALAAVRRSR